MLRLHASSLILATLLAPALLAQEGPPPPSDGASPAGRERGAEQVLLEAPTAPGIAWFGRWDDAKAEAERTGRPILLMSAAPQCSGAPGVW